MIKIILILIIVLCIIKAIILQEPRVYTPRGYTSIDAPWEMPVKIDSILTPEECQYIIDISQSRFQPSQVVGGLLQNTRTSETAWIAKDDPVSLKIASKINELVGCKEDECELVQVVRYKPGTYYREHHDSCCDVSESCLEFEKMGGQRTATLLIYLNEDFEEGETWFPKINLKIKTEKGSGILFRPLGQHDDRCHPKALHAGLPIKSGTKYICNVWVREKKIMFNH